MMTVAAAFMGLLPIMWSTSAGADVMKRIAAPMIGGLVTSFVLELLVYPAIYKLWKQRELGNAPDPRLPRPPASPAPRRRRTAQTKEQEHDEPRCSTTSRSAPC